jgi:hypothetical protein
MPPFRSDGVAVDAEAFVIFSWIETDSARPACGFWANTALAGEVVVGGLAEGFVASAANAVRNDTAKHRPSRANFRIISLFITAIHQVYRHDGYFA